MEQTNKQEAKSPIVREYKIGDITYIVKAVVKDGVKEDAATKVRRLIHNDLKQEKSPVRTPKHIIRRSMHQRCRHPRSQYPPPLRRSRKQRYRSLSRQIQLRHIQPHPLHRAKHDPVQYRHEICTLRRETQMVEKNHEIKTTNT